MRRIAYNLAPKIITVFLLALVLWIAQAAAQSVERSRRIEREVSSLQDEADRIEKDNGVLRERINYLQTDAFQEEEAKKKLNYQKSQERVVVIRQQPDRGGAHSEESPPPLVQKVDPRPNYEKWWSEFFP